jgi:hypothetical protein
LDDFKKANAKESEGHGETIHLRWKALTLGMQKLNWDVAVDTTKWTNRNVYHSEGLRGLCPGNEKPNKIGE